MKTALVLGLMALSLPSFASRNVVFTCTAQEGMKNPVTYKLDNPYGGGKTFSFTSSKKQTFNVVLMIQETEGTRDLMDISMLIEPSHDASALLIHGKGVMKEEKYITSGVVATLFPSKNGSLLSGVTISCKM